MNDRINARLPKPLVEHVNRMVGSDKLFETPSEYLRFLIRKDMESEASKVYASKCVSKEDRVAREKVLFQEIRQKLEETFPDASPTQRSQAMQQVLKKAIF